jgi:hypothetical protein
VLDRPLPEGTVSRAEAAEMLGVLPRRITKLVKAGKLEHPPTGKVDGLVWHHEVKAFAAARLECRHRRRSKPAERPLPDLPPDQEATLEERLAAARWTRDGPGPFVDSAGAAAILGVSRSTSACSRRRVDCRGCQQGALVVSRRGCTGGRKST